MNREIKFRVWDSTRNKIWYIGSTNGFENYTFALDFMKGWQVIRCKRVYASSEWSGDILMQFTGLRDRNGKEIYEGDIVKWSNRIYSVDLHNQTERYRCGVFAVEFQNGGFGNKCGEEFYHFFCYQNREVIGNIFENPELLKCTKT